MSAAVDTSEPTQTADRFPFRDVGRLHYSRGPMIAGGTSWWVVLWTDLELARYYRELFRLFRYRCQRMQRPAWDPHVTLIRGEEPCDDRKSLWGALEDRTFEFEYSPLAETDGDYWWLPVRSEALLDLREELGLPREPEYALHVSFGRLEQLD